ncbi:MAG: filamentous hemagglutinin N-terminal domain-containing protein [Caulobacteraceae bacterium]
MSPLLFARRRQLLVRTALGGVAAAALLACALARAQVGVAGLKLPGTPTPTLNTSNLINHSSCGGASSCDGLLFVSAVGTAALPETDFQVNTARAIINWSQFDIGYTGPAGFDTVKFIFAARDDIVVNLVNSPTASATQINGMLDGMLPIALNGDYAGNIWIINSAGVVFGANSVVNTGGLLATTAQLASQANFLAGGDASTVSFVGAPAGSEVRVGGAITGYGGTLAFIAPVVSTTATANITGATPGGPTCSFVNRPCGADVLYGATTAYDITFTPNANNDLDLFSFIVPAGGGTASSTPLTLAGATTAGNVYIASVNEADVVGAVVAPGAITATTAGGSNGDIVLSAGGGLQNTGGVVTPVTNAGVGTTSAEFDSPLSADGGINLATNGSLAMTSTATAQTGDIDITAAGALTGPAASLDAVDGAVNVTAASFDIGTVTAGGDVTLIGTGSGASGVTNSVNSIGGSIGITTGGPLDAGAATLTAGDGAITVNAASFDVGAAIATLSLTLNGTGSGTDSIATLASANDDDVTITGGGALDAGAAAISSSAGSVTVDTASFDIGSVSGYGPVTLTGTGSGPNAIAISATSSTGDLDITGGGPLSADGAALTAPDGNISVDVANFSIGSATAGGTLTLTGTGSGTDSIATSASAAGDVAITGGGALDADGAAITSLDGSVTVDTASFDIGSVSGYGPVTLTGTSTDPNVIEQTASSGAGNLQITAGGSLQAGDAALRAKAGGIDVNVASFDIGVADGLDTVSITGTGSGASAIEQSALSRAGDLDVIAGGPLNAIDATFTSLNGNVVASAGPNGTADPDFPLAIGQVTAAQTLILQGGSVSLAEASSAGSWIYVRTGALNLDGALTSDAYITIASTAGNLNLGDDVFDAPVGLDIGNATFNALVAPLGWVALYAGDPGNSVLGQMGGARGDLTVGALSVNAGNAPSLYLFADGGHTVAFTGPVTNSLDFGNMLTVGGAPPPSIATATTDWTPAQILIEAQGAASGGPDGSIGTPDSPLASVAFNAVNDVIMGTPGFIDAVDATPGAAIDVLGGSPPVPASAAAASGEILLASDTLTLLANGKIVQQNTSQGTGYSGLVVEGSVEFPVALTLGCVSCTAASPPTVIDLFGTIGDGQGNTVTGRAVALSPEIELQPPLAIDLQYRANGCVIKLRGVCGPINIVPIIPVISELPPTNTIETLLTIFPEPPLLDIADFEGQADVTIIGSGNEEIWRTTDSDKCISNPASTSCPRR